MIFTKDVYTYKASGESLWFLKELRKEYYPLWLVPEKKIDLYVWVGISAFGKVLLTHYADAQFILEGSDEAEIEKKNYV